MALVIDSLRPQETVLLVIDMQNDFVAKGAPLETAMALKMLPQMQKMLAFAREKDIQVIYTRHVHREDGSDMGLFSQIYPGLGLRQALIDEHEGSQIYPEVAPEAGDLVIKKHRYSAFYGTDLDIILRTKGIKNVIITGATTEDCCLATARDAMYRDYRVAFVSDLTGTYAYPDIGFGSITAKDLHETILTVVGVTTGHVMTSEELMDKVQ